MLIMMLLVSEARRARVDTKVDAPTYSDVTGGAGDGFGRVVERVQDLMSHPSLHEAVEQVAALRDVDGGDECVDERIWDALEVLMKNPIFNAEARRLAINLANAMADLRFAQHIQELSAFITGTEAAEEGKSSRRLPKSERRVKTHSLAAPASAFSIPLHAPQVRQQEAQRIPRVHMQAKFDPLRIKEFGPQPLKKFVPSLLKATPTPNAAAAALTAAAVALHAEAAHAKSVMGANGALDFGTLVGDLPSREGTGKALDNKYSLVFGLFGIVFVIGLARAQRQSYQDDDKKNSDSLGGRRATRPKKSDSLGGRRATRPLGANIGANIGYLGLLAYISPVFVAALAKAGVIDPPPLNTFTAIANNAADLAFASGEIPRNIMTVYSFQQWADLLQQYFADGKTTEFLTRVGGVCAQHPGWCDGVTIGSPELWGGAI